MVIKESVSYKIFKIFNCIIMLIVCVLMIFPYLHIIAKAFNDGVDASRGGIGIFPRVFTLENFRSIFNDPTMSQSAFITVSRVVIGTLLSLVVQFSAAYALSRESFPGKRIFVALLIIPTFIQAGQIPTYVLYSKVKLLNSFLVYILPSLFSYYNVVIIRTFIQTTIPRSVEEAALIDGANEIAIFSRIILPLSKPVLATIALWILVAHWNDWTSTLLYVTDPRLYTLQYKMMEVVKESERIQKMLAEAVASGQVVDASSLTTTTESLTAAQVVVTTVPIMCVYPFLQKYFVKGIMLGSVKG